MKPIRVVVNDRMQRGFVYYRTEPVGRGFDEGFEPELSPADMLRLGVFGGKYMTDCRAEFPRSWFAHAKLCPERHDPTLNYFGVNASQSLAIWRKKGWIYPDDPRGWFSGTAGTTWDVVRSTTSDRSSDGARCGGTSPRFATRAHAGR